MDVILGSIYDPVVPSDFVQACQVACSQLSKRLAFPAELLDAGINIETIAKLSQHRAKGIKYLVILALEDICCSEELKDAVSGWFKNLKSLDKLAVADIHIKARAELITAVE